jgi:hypothetical protein
MNFLNIEIQEIGGVLTFIMVFILIKILNANKKHPGKPYSYRYLEEALVNDSSGITEEVIKSLRKAVLIETHTQEKRRLELILDNYLKRKSNLAEFVKKYPTFLTVKK